MTVEPWLIAVVSAASLAAGFVDSIAGGGGLLLVPALLLAGLPPQFALGTTKFASSFGTGAALANYVRNGKVVWKVALTGIVFTLVASWLGSRAVLGFDERFAGRLVVFLLPVAIISTLVRRPTAEPTSEPTGWKLALGVPAICAALGFYDGFFGPGTGSFLILAFSLFLGLDFVRASGTAKFFNLASNLGALAVFALHGKVVLAVGVPLALANIAGNQCGSSLALRRGAGLVRGFLLVSLAILLVSLVVKFCL